MAPHRSLATDQDRVTFEPVASDVAPAELSAPVLSSALAMNREVAGEDAEVTEVPVATSPATMSPGVLPAEVTLAVLPLP